MARSRGKAKSSGDVTHPPPACRVERALVYDGLNMAGLLGAVLALFLTGVAQAQADRVLLFVDGRGEDLIRVSGKGRWVQDPGLVRVGIAALRIEPTGAEKYPGFTRLEHQDARGAGRSSSACSWKATRSGRTASRWTTTGTTRLRTTWRSTYETLSPRMERGGRRDRGPQDREGPRPARRPGALRPPDDEELREGRPGPRARRRLRQGRRAGAAASQDPRDPSGGRSRDGRDGRGTGSSRSKTGSTARWP